MSHNFLKSCAMKYNKSFYVWNPERSQNFYLQNVLAGEGDEHQFWRIPLTIFCRDGKDISAPRASSSGPHLAQ